jgi:hypothetical protein
MFSDGNEAASPAPPPPRFARYASSSGPPPPLSRGRMVRALTFSQRSRARGLPTKATNSSSPQRKIRGGGAPKRRNCPVGPRHAIRCCHPNALRARPRVQRNALAFRRSTAALASAMCRGSIQAALHAMQCAGVTRSLAPRLSEAPRAPVVMPAGSMPGPPESGSDEPPPAGTAPTPSVGVTG